MTHQEIEAKLEALQQELLALRWEVLQQKGGAVAPNFGPLGAFKDDEHFAEAMRLGREYREKINRESLEEMDRVELKAQRKKPGNGSPKKPPAKKSNARP